MRTAGASTPRGLRSFCGRGPASDDGGRLERFVDNRSASSTWMFSRTSSRNALASSSLKSRAYMSSLARIFLAFENICFSPVERPLTAWRMARLRTTSATSKMSPVLSLSRLCL